MKTCRNTCQKYNCTRVRQASQTTPNDRSKWAEWAAKAGRPAVVSPPELINDPVRRQVRKPFTIFAKILNNKSSARGISLCPSVCDGWRLVLCAPV